MSEAFSWYHFKHPLVIQIKMEWSYQGEPKVPYTTDYEYK